MKINQRFKPLTTLLLLSLILITLISLVGCQKHQETLTKQQAIRMCSEKIPKKNQFKLEKRVDSIQKHTAQIKYNPKNNLIYVNCKNIHLNKAKNSLILAVSRYSTQRLGRQYHDRKIGIIVNKHHRTLAIVQHGKIRYQKGIPFNKTQENKDYAKLRLLTSIGH